MFTVSVDIKIVTLLHCNRLTIECESEVQHSYSRRCISSFTYTHNDKITASSVSWLVSITLIFHDLVCNKIRAV